MKTDKIPKRWSQIEKLPLHLQKEFALWGVGEGSLEEVDLKV